MNDELQGLMRRIQIAALGTGGVALALSFVGAIIDPKQFLHSYLFAFLFWNGASLGCLALLMLHHLVGGGWGFVLRRLLEAATRTIPLMAILAIPLLIGVPTLYSWAQPSEHAAFIHHKRPYLDHGFFAARTVVYFLMWMLLAWFLNKWSAEQDTTGDPRVLQKLRKLSGPGLVAYCLIATFASVDWVMSLLPEWFSSGYGLLFIAGEVLTALALMTLLALLISKRTSLAYAFTAQRMLDLGNLILAFVMLWTYIAFSQFLIIYAGNLPEEIVWYQMHTRGGWLAVAAALLLFHFALPFVLLLFRHIKRSAPALMGIAALVLAMRLVDGFWTVAATAHPGFHLSWIDLSAPVGIGGLWLAVFIRQLKRRPLLPVHPGLEGIASPGAQPAEAA